MLTGKDEQLKYKNLSLKNNSLNILFNQTSSSTRSRKGVLPIKGTVMLLQNNA
jgi:hypothetical protein